MKPLLSIITAVKVVMYVMDEAKGETPSINNLQVMLGLSIRQELIPKDHKISYDLKIDNDSQNYKKGNYQYG